MPPALVDALKPDQLNVLRWLMAEGRLRTSVITERAGMPAFRTVGYLQKLKRALVPLGSRLESEQLPDGELQWRYVGPEEAQ